MSTWFRVGRGTALGIMVGALTLGSAAPQFCEFGIMPLHARLRRLVATGNHSMLHVGCTRQRQNTVHSGTVEAIPLRQGMKFRISMPEIAADPPAAERAPLATDRG